MKERIRVAFVDARYHSFYGAQRSLFTLITNLGSEKIEPVVLLPGEGILAEEYRSAGVLTEVLPLYDEANKFGGQIPQASLWTKIKVAFALLAYNWKVRRWLKQQDVDIVYVNDMRALFYVVLAAKLTFKPLIWYVRADGTPTALTRIALRLADLVILIADGVKSLFHAGDQQMYRHKFRTLYTGFKLPTYDARTRNSSGQKVRLRYEIPMDAFVIGLVGSITQRKGHDLLIKATQLLVAKGINCHLLFVGDTPPSHSDYRIALEEQIVSAALKSRVHWVGFQKDVWDFYQAMDVLALPSRSEGLPRTVIEGLAMGLPVVASDVGGVKEILVSKELGRVVPPDDVEELANACEALLLEANAEELRRLRVNYVQERFTIEAYVRGFERIVESITLNS